VIGAAELAEMGWAWRWLAGRREREALTRFAEALAAPLTHALGQPREAAELLSSALAAARAAGGDPVTRLEAALAEAEAYGGELDTAEARLRRLLEAGLDAEEQAAVRLRLAVILAARGQFCASAGLRAAAVSMLRGRLARLSEPRAEGMLAWALWDLAEDWRRLGDVEAAQAALDESFDLFEGCRSLEGRAAVLARRAAMHLDHGETVEAHGCARASQSLAEQMEDRPGLARALQVAGSILGGELPALGMERVERAIGIWEAMGRPVDQAAALLDLAALASQGEGGLEREMMAARRALDLSRRHRLPGTEAAALIALAGAYQRAGQPERAESYARRAACACRATDDLLVRRRCEQWSDSERGGSVEERRAPGTRAAGDGVTSASTVNAELDGAGWCSRSHSDHPLTPSLPHAPASVPPLLIRLLGPLTVEGPKGTLTAASLRPKEQRVLARLALSPGEVVPRDELLDLFWHRSPVAAAERSLRTVVSSLRASLRPLLEGKPPRLITGRLDGYRLEAEACAVDAELFARAVRMARGSSAGVASPERALPEWRRAGALYRGDLLLAFQYEDWCLSARERLRNDFLEVLFRLAHVAMEAGRTAEASRHAARMVEIDPTEERAHRLLMRCYVFLDRPAEALRQFERCRAALWEELAARPSPSTVSLRHAIREGLTFADDKEAATEPAALSAGSLLR
jgi:DNA-binding SARP family transcriptional activator